MPFITLMDEFALSSFHWPSIAMVPSIITVSPSKLLINVGDELEDVKLSIEICS